MSGGRWRWSWTAVDGGEAGHLGLALVGDRARVTATVRRPGHPLVELDEPDGPMPRLPSLELRASGLWVDAIEEEPGRRWGIGLEAFALEVAAPGDAVGVRVPLGFDLEWEATGEPQAAGLRTARVHGEVLVGADAIEVDAEGWWTITGGGAPSS